MSSKLFSRSLNRSVGFVSLALLLSFVSACSTKLKLPANSPEMEKIYLIKYSTWGHHSLAFHRNGKLIEFTYGDWDLFALNRRDWWTAWKNMTFFTQGALGRKSISWNPEKSICNNFKGCEIVVPFLAPTDKVSDLYNVLKSSYDKKSNTEIYNKQEEVFFVKYDVPYWGFHNCNHELADWLSKLGVEVSGKLFYEPSFIEGMETN